MPCAAHEDLPVREAAKAQGVSPRTAYKWLRRYREEGEAGLFDRSSRPRRSPRHTPEKVRKQVVRFRRRRWPTTPSFSGRTFLRAWWGIFNRSSTLEPKPLPECFEVEVPGVLLHPDTKKLARLERPGHRVTGDRRRAFSRGGLRRGLCRGGRS